eukprot:TRINITY_DN12765_c0_g1_i1.p1 TRINITY_DN12765_c0_g1~~TRINITY_DN12765_c0_g1_i1.p1  ORF type:complete len:537 (+),score=162.84 TRINITY_DN12765_c0_g1_i1:111-1721(+)
MLMPCLNRRAFRFTCQSPLSRAGAGLPMEAPSNDSAFSCLVDDAEMDPVSMRDALRKIRELRAAHREREAALEDKISALTQEMIALRKVHVEDVKKVRATAKEREQVLLDEIDPAKVRAKVVAEVSRDAEAVVEKLRGEIAVVQEDAARARAALEAMQQEVQGREAAATETSAAREAELQYLQQTILRGEEEGDLLRLSLERERELLSSEREMWAATQSQAADALAAYRQRAAKAELNARWVSTVQQSLHAKDVTAKAATAATELLLDLLEAVRTALGPIPIDAILHKALRVAPSVGRAVQSGVDVALLLAGGLLGFSEARASANTSGNAGAAAGAAIEAGPGAAARAGSTLRSRSRSPRVEGVAMMGIGVGGSPRRAGSAGAALGVGTPPGLAKQRELLHRARQLQIEAEKLSQPRELESPQWSPAQPDKASYTPERGTPGASPPARPSRSPLRQARPSAGVAGSRSASPQPPAKSVVPTPPPPPPPAAAAAPPPAVGLPFPPPPPPPHAQGYPPAPPAHEWRHAGSAMDIYECL